MFAFMYHALFVDLLLPEDDLFTRCRKAVITCYGIFGIILINDVLCNKYLYPYVPIDTALGIQRKETISSIHVVSLIWIASWIYAKFTRTGQDWLINFNMVMLYAYFCDYI